MLTAKNLERIMELEQQLKAEYQGQIDAKTAEVEAGKKMIEKLQKTVDTQLQTIGDLSQKAVANDKTEQQTREVTNRAGKLQEEVATLKARTKTLQKDLAKEREEVKELKKFDPPRMKKNLDANKKKLAEANAANTALKQAINKVKGEKAELQRTIAELEAKLAELEPVEDAQDSSEEVSAATDEIAVADESATTEAGTASEAMDNEAVKAA